MTMKSGNTDVYENEIPGTLKMNVEFMIMIMIMYSCVIVIQL